MKRYRLSAAMRRRVAAWATGSLYRMNAGTADCYAFTLYRNNKGRIDFDGGWDWSEALVDDKAEWLYFMDAGTFKKRNHYTRG